jgi:hypothetical protein
VERTCSENAPAGRTYLVDSTISFLTPPEHLIKMMSAIRSRTILGRIARPALAISRPQPLPSILQRQGLASHQNMTHLQIPDEKVENVVEKRFNQIDMDGKVFVNTGAASSPPHPRV